MDLHHAQPCARRGQDGVLAAIDTRTNKIAWQQRTATRNVREAAPRPRPAD